MTNRHSMIPAFILAGGAGERLAPLTEAKPKPAVSFGGTHQILDFTLSNCINSGFRKIFVLTQYQRDYLHDYIRQTRLRLSATFQWDRGDQLLPAPPAGGKRYRGTADAVFQNLPLLRFETAEHVLIASGDHVYSMDYRPLLARHIASGAEMTIAAVRRPAIEASAFGVLDVDHDSVTRFREKPAPEALPATGDVLVSMGVYVFRRSSLVALADRATPMEMDFGRDIVPGLIRGQKVAAYDFGEAPRNYWRDVGTLDSYFQASMDLLGPRPEFDLEMDSQWPVFSIGDPSSVRAGDSRISRRAVVESSTIRRSVISHGACVEQGAIVENSIVLPGARVGMNARVRNAIVVEGARVPDGVKIGMNARLDRVRFAVTPGGVVVVSADPRRSFHPIAHARCPEIVAAA